MFTCRTESGLSGLLAVRKDNHALLHKSNLCLCQKEYLYEVTHYYQGASSTQPSIISRGKKLITQTLLIYNSVNTKEKNSCEMDIYHHSVELTGKIEHVQPLGRLSPPPTPMSVYYTQGLSFTTNPRPYNKTTKIYPVQGFPTK